MSTRNLATDDCEQIEEQKATHCTFHVVNVSWERKLGCFYFVFRLDNPAQNCPREIQSLPFVASISMKSLQHGSEKLCVKIRAVPNQPEHREAAVSRGKCDVPTNTISNKNIPSSNSFFSLVEL